MGISFFLFFDRFPSVEDWSHLMQPAFISASAWFILLFLAAIVLRVMRWYILAEGRIRASWWSMSGAYAWSFLLMTVTPLRMGELYRTYWSAKRNGSVGHATGVIVLERLTDLIVLLTALVVGCLLVPDVRALVPSFLLAFFASIVIVGGACIIYFPRSSSDVLGRLGHGNRLVEVISEMLVSFEVAKQSKPMLGLFVITVSIWTVLAVGYWAIFSSVFPTVHWTIPVLALTLVNLSSVLWISPGNIGMFEAMIVAVLVIGNFDQTQALALAVSLHTVILGLIAVTGALGWMTLRPNERFLT